MLHQLTISLLITLATGQSVNSVGVSGGTGPKGGIGDVDNPVKEAQAWITHGDFQPNSQKLQAGTAPKLVSGPVPNSNNEWAVKIDGSPNGARQEILGFGHAWTDSTVEVFNKLKPEKLNEVMQELFGQDGNNMGLMRHTIGSSDMSGTQYSYDDNGPGFNQGQPDPSLDNFNITDNGRAMAKMIAKMGEFKSDVTLFGSPWSAPGWMKDSGMFIMPNKNGQPGSPNWANNTLRQDYHQQYSQYFGKYIDAFKEEGVTVNAITPENEPLNLQGGYPCMGLDAASEGSLIKDYLGEEMSKRNVGVWAYDHNSDTPQYPEQVMQTAGDQVQATAWHCYMNPNYTVMSQFHDKHPDTMQFMSECTGEESGVATPSHIMQPITNYASGAAMWVLATNDEYGPHSPYGGCANCVGSIKVHDENTYSKTLVYYMIGQFSRFVRRGAVNHEVKEGNYGNNMLTKQFYVNAFQNPDKSWIVVMLNNMQEDKEAVVSIEGTGKQLVYTGTLPEYTLNTWVLPASDGDNQEPGKPVATGARNSTIQLPENSASAEIGPVQTWPSKQGAVSVSLPVPLHTAPVQNSTY